MPRPDPQRAIEEARKNFDAVLHTPEFRRVHADDAQLELLIDLLAVAPGGRYLDLGTGNGYAAFGIAARHPDCRITGIDIAGKAIERNIALAREKGLTNVEFEAMDGIRLGVPVNAFDGVICRYALHHLPALRTTLRDVFEALKGCGRFVIADPIMADDDAGDPANQRPPHVGRDPARIEDEHSHGAGHAADAAGTGCLPEEPEMRRGTPSGA